jgi:hypothetical protein
VSVSNKPVEAIILQVPNKVGFYRRQLMTGTVLTLTADAVTIQDSGGKFVYPRADYVAPTPVPAPTPTPAPTPSPVGVKPPKLSGITYSQPDPVHPLSWAGHQIGWCDPVGGIGPYTWWVSDIGGRYGIDATGQIYAPWAQLGPDAHEIEVRCTDGRGDTVSAKFPIKKTDGSTPVVTMGVRNPKHNCTVRPFDNPIFLANIAGTDNDTAWGRFVTRRPDGGLPAFSESWGWARANYGVPGVTTADGTSVNPGVYPLIWDYTKDGKTLSLTRAVQVVPYTPISYIEFEPVTAISTSTLPDTYVGTLSVTTPNNGFSTVLTDNAGGLFRVDASQRRIIVKHTPDKAGPVDLSITIKDGPATFTQKFTIQVVQGVTLAPEKMTIVVNPALDDVTLNQHVADVKIDPKLFAGKLTYKIVSQTRCNEATLAWGMPARYAISDTGSIDAAPLLSTGEPDVLVVSVTDGITTCTRSVTVTVAPTKLITHYYVGKGDPKTRGEGVPPDAIPIKSMAAMRGQCIWWHKDHKYIHVEPGDYADDTGTHAMPDGSGDYGVRGPWIGPGTIEWIGAGKPGAPAPKGYFGGSATNDRPGGADMRGKGSLVLGDGDWTLIGMPFGHTHGGDQTHGLEAVRKDGETYGDLTLIGCVIQDCDNGLESGGGHSIITADRCEFGNCGTSHVSSGACHNIYNGSQWKFVMKGCVSRRATLGHLVKTRAQINVITGNRIFDGLVGSASCRIDTPNGGLTTIENNVIETGTMPMNPNAVQHGAEWVTYEDNRLFFRNNTVSILALDGSHAGTNTALTVVAQNSPSGVKLHAEVADNKFYATDKSGAKGRFVLAWNYDPKWPLDGAFTETGTVVLTSPPVIDMTRPWFAGELPPLGPLYFHGLWGQDYFANFEGVQQIPDRDQIVVHRTDKAGTVLLKVYAHNDLQSQTVNKFVAGTKAALTRQPVYYPQALPDPWAPDAWFGVATDADGLATVSLAVDAAGLSVPDGVAYFQLRFTAPDGTLCDNRYAVKVVA